MYAYENQQIALEIIDRLPSELVKYIHSKMTNADWKCAFNRLIRHIFGYVFFASCRPLAFKECDYKALVYELHSHQLCPDMNFWKFVMDNPNVFPFDWHNLYHFLSHGIRYIRYTTIVLDFVVLDQQSKLDIGFAVLHNNEWLTEPDMSIKLLNRMYAHGAIRRLEGSEDFYTNQLTTSVIKLTENEPMGSYLRCDDEPLFACILCDDVRIFSRSVPIVIRPPLTLEKVLKVMRPYMPVQSRFSHIEWPPIFKSKSTIQYLVFYPL